MQGKERMVKKEYGMKLKERIILRWTGEKNDDNNRYRLKTFKNEYEEYEERIEKEGN